MNLNFAKRQVSFLFETKEIEVFTSDPNQEEQPNGDKFFSHTFAQKAGECL